MWISLTSKISLFHSIYTMKGIKVKRNGSNELADEVRLGYTQNNDI